MKVLVLNCGSSSIKYQVMDMNNEPVLLAKGIVERIGLEMGDFTHKPVGKDKYTKQCPIPNHTVGIDMVLAALTDKAHGVINDVKEIAACGHRVAHGGEYFKKSELITEDAKAKIKELCALAPLHNPANLEGILVMEKLLPGIPQVAVFDTSFHQTMPSKAYLYGVDYKYYEQDKIRRYGFHGTSHKFVAEKACRILGKDIKNQKIITCHLGNGASVTAIQNGESVDTSMGFTPVEGLIMGTRTGDLDLGALLYIAEKENMNVKEMNNFVNKKSGMASLSGCGSDMRDIEDAAMHGNTRALDSLKAYAYRVKKYVGAYAAALGGVDILIFTGGVGENGDNVRACVCEKMEFLGIEFDENANHGVKGQDKMISKPDSKTKVMIITTDEELVIATDTYNIIK